jgi:hypothetical protein
MMAGVATAEAEKPCEAQGLDAMESEWTREGAVRQAHWLYDEQGQRGGYDDGDEGNGYGQKQGRKWGLLKRWF